MKLVEGFQLLEEDQLLQEFHVEELEKRYEFAWISNAQVITPYGNVTVYG